MILHWLIAVGVFTNWRLAEAAHHAAQADKGALMGSHKAVGMTILVLTLVLIGWRLAHPRPPLASTLKQWERLLARAVHSLFYILLVTLPLLGWIASSSFGKGVDIFGLFTVPALPVASAPDTGEQIFEVHHFLGSVIVYLMFLHILGALKHTFFDRDGNLFRMLPFGTPKP